MGNKSIGLGFQFVVRPGRFITANEEIMKLKNKATKGTTVTVTEDITGTDKTTNPEITSASKLTSATSSYGALLRLPQVLARFPVGRSTWYAGVNKGVYPKPVLISRRVVAWPQEFINALIRRQASGALR